MRGGGIRNSADHIQLLCNAMRGGGIWINADHIQLLCNATRGGGIWINADQRYEDAQSLNVISVCDIYF